eukprot:4422444-Prymnesium_polylepis.1
MLVDRDSLHGDAQADGAAKQPERALAPRGIGLRARSPRLSPFGVQQAGLLPRIEPELDDIHVTPVPLAQLRLGGP